MDLLGLNVIHGKFGPGIVTKENGRTITVEFLNRTSSFFHPDAFYLHLKAEDESIQQILEREAIASIEQGRQAQIAWQKDRDEQIRAQVSKLYHPVNDFNEFMQIAQHIVWTIDDGVILVSLFAALPDIGSVTHILFLPYALWPPTSLWRSLDLAPSRKFVPFRTAFLPNLSFIVRTASWRRRSLSRSFCCSFCSASCCA